MIRVLFYSLFILNLLTLTSYAEDISKDEIINTRQVLGSALNETVKTIKELFMEKEADLETTRQDLEDLKETSQQIQDSSKYLEINATVLKHGRASNPTTCNDNEELFWDGSIWKCQVPGVGQDCVAADSELRQATEDGSGYECVKKGTYASEYSGWGTCNNTKGERYLQSACMFDNTVTKQSPDYQVDDSYCSGGLKVYEQACGSNGARSSCKCPSGTKYAYVSGKGICKADPDKTGTSPTCPSGTFYDVEDDLCYPNTGKEAPVCIDGKIIDKSQCVLDICGSWNYGSWTACSVCGGLSKRGANCNRIMCFDTPEVEKTCPAVVNCRPVMQCNETADYIDGDMCCRSNPSHYVAVKRGQINHEEGRCYRSISYVWDGRAIFRTGHQDYGCNSPLNPSFYDRYVAPTYKTGRSSNRAGLRTSYGSTISGYYICKVLCDSGYTYDDLSGMCKPN